MTLGAQSAANAAAGMGANVLPKVNGNKPAEGVATLPRVEVSPQSVGPERNAGVSVRLAQTEVDIVAMLNLGRQLHAESRFRTLPLDEARMREAGRRALANGNPGLILAERDGELVGMAVVMLGEHFFSPAMAATVQLLYVHPKARGGSAAVKLLRALRRWAAQNNAHDLHVNVTTGIEAARTDRFLRKMGFRQTGGNYVLEGVAK